MQMQNWSIQLRKNHVRQMWKVMPTSAQKVRWRIDLNVLASTLTVARPSRREAERFYAELLHIDNVALSAALVA